MIKERRLIERDTAAGGACGQEALRLLIMRANHGQALRLIHLDGDLYSNTEGRGHSGKDERKRRDRGKAAYFLTK